MSNSNENLIYLIEQLIGTIHSMMDLAQYIDRKCSNIRKLATQSTKSEEKPLEHTNSDTQNEENKSEDASSLTRDKNMDEIIRLNNRFENDKYLSQNSHQSRSENKAPVQNMWNQESSTRTEFNRQRPRSPPDPPRFILFIDGIQHEDLRRTHKESKEMFL